MPEAKGKSMPDNYNGSAAGLLLREFAKSGPWALLVLMLLGGIGYFFHEFLDATASSIRQYVSITAESTERLQQSTVISQQLIQKNGDQIKDVLDATLQTLAQIDAAYKMMQDVPAMRIRQMSEMQEQSDTLNAIKTLLQEQAAHTSEN